MAQHRLVENIANTLDMALAWHLKELKKLCPAGTLFTLVCRIDKTEQVLVLGDEPNTKFALLAALKAVNAQRSDRAAGIRAHNINDPVPLAAELVEGEQAGPALDVLDFNLNGGQIGGGNA